VPMPLKPALTGSGFGTNLDGDCSDVSSFHSGDIADGQDARNDATRRSEYTGDSSNDASEDASHGSTRDGGDLSEDDTGDSEDATDDATVTVQALAMKLMRIAKKQTITRLRIAMIRATAPLRIVMTRRRTIAWWLRIAKARVIWRWIASKRTRKWLCAKRPGRMQNGAETWSPKSTRRVNTRSTRMKTRVETR
jgi:hypothetical protein